MLNWHLLESLHLELELSNDFNRQFLLGLAGQYLAMFYEVWTINLSHRKISIQSAIKSKMIIIYTRGPHRLVAIPSKDALCQWRNKNFLLRNTKMPMFKQRRVNPFRVSRKFFGSNFEKILNSMNYDDFKNAITSLGALTVNNFIYFFCCCLYFRMNNSNEWSRFCFLLFTTLCAFICWRWQKKETSEQLWCWKIKTKTKQYYEKFACV